MTPDRPSRPVESRRTPLFLCLGLALVLLATTARAQEVSFDLPAGSLATSLNMLARQAGLTLSVNPALVRDKTAPAVSGNYTIHDALDRILSGSGLAARTQGNTVVVSSAEEADSDVRRLDPVRVGAAADVSGQGLSPPYTGGQVARGGSLGMLGSTDYMESPFSQITYTAEHVENSQAATLTQVLESSPSVRRSGGRFSSNDDVNIRGFFVSGADTSYDGLFGLGTFRRNTIDEIERVELLKGPSALLNGVPPEGGVGGIINLIPKRATAAPVTDITVNHLSDSIFGGHIDVGRRFGNSDAFGIRVNAAHSDGDTPFDNNSEALSLASLALDYVGEDLRVYGNFNYEDQEQDASIFSGLSVTPGIQIPDPPDASTNLNAPFTKTETERSYNLVRAEYDITGNWETRLGYGWQQSDELQYIHFGSRILNSNGDYTEPSFYRLRNGDYDYQTLDAKLIGDFETGLVSHRIAIAAYWLEREIDSLTQNQAVAGDGIFNIYDPDVFSYQEPDFSTVTPSRAHFELIQEGIAFSDTLGVMDGRLQLVVGAREQRIKNTNVATGVTDYDESALTPAVALTFHAFESVSFYGNYIQGLSRAPSPPSTAVNADEIFPPAKTEQLEIGAKLDFGSLGGTIALFEIKQPNGVTDPVTNIFSLDGEQRNRGIELETFGEIVPGVRVLGGISYIQPKLTNTQDGTNDGKTASGTPRLTINLSGEWDIPFVPNLTLTGRIVHTGEQYLDTANTLQIPDWTRVDLGARYLLHVSDYPITVRAGITNLLGEDYWETSGLILGEPRSLSISASASF